MNLARIIDGHPSDHVAIIASGVETTYGQLRDHVARLRGGLAALGLGAGDRVALLQQRGHFVETYLAVSGAGRDVAAEPTEPSRD